MPEQPANKQRDEVREPLVFEFPKPLLTQQPVRVIVEFASGVVRFVRCHRLRREGFWSNLLRRPEEDFECPFADILDVYESETKGTYYLVIITAHGWVSWPVRSSFTKAPPNYEEFRAFLSQLSDSTPPALYRQTKEGKSQGQRTIGCLLLAAFVVAFLIAVIGALLQWD